MKQCNSSTYCNVIPCCYYIFVSIFMCHLYSLWLLPSDTETSPFRICQEATDSRTTTEALGSRASQHNWGIFFWWETIEVREGFKRFLFARIAKYIQISFFLIYQLMAFVINFDALHTKWWSLVKIIAFRRRGDMLWSQLEKHWQTEHQMSRFSLVQNDCSLIDSRISPWGFECLDTFGYALRL